VSKDNEVISNNNNNKSIKEECLIDAAIPSSHSLHSTITEKLQKYTDLKEELIRIWRLKTAYITQLALSKTGIITNKLYESLRLLNLRPALYILMQKTSILNTCRIVRKFFCRTVNKKCLVSETVRS
jgi:hypothetical protein